MHGEEKTNRVIGVNLAENKISGKIVDCGLYIHKKLGPGLLMNFNVPLFKNGLKRIVL